MIRKFKYLIIRKKIKEIRSKWRSINCEKCEKRINKKELIYNEESKSIKNTKYLKLYNISSY